MIKGGEKMPENYLDADADRDRNNAENIRSLTERALSTLLKTRFETGVWPYELVAGEPYAAPPRFSMSTQAMILHALAVSTGLIKRSGLVPALEGRNPMQEPPKGSLEAVRSGVTTVLDQLLSPNSEPATEKSDLEGAREPSLTQSSTWGMDDPLTLTWLYEVLNPENPILEASDQERARLVRGRIESVAERLVTEALRYPPGPLLTASTDVRASAPHPFILLRVVQLALQLGSDHPVARKVRSNPVEAMFRNALNAELTNSSVKDGGFDPASLVFSLEGLILLNVDSVQDALLDRVLEVLAVAQDAGSHWRPVHPITSTPQGLVLLPQSIEVANSFLRICAHWARSRGPLFSNSLSLIRQYADWATASSVTLTTADEESHTGWQSEHTYTPGTIHLWATSQAVLFLEHFAAMLDTHVAAASRAAASLDFIPATPRSQESRRSRWNKKSDHEPLLGLPASSRYRVYSLVEDMLLEPTRSGGQPSLFSMLLYGPPGTGKTDFSRALADALGYDFITVSPSDFTRAGEAGVEARAQQVFKVLGLQSRCVILFDEIDRLLLDRDSDEYGKQGDMFQFMTPSMLTKINDLRRAENCVFVIATNYADKIDGAIKRPGRIDEQLLLLPPDIGQRRSIVRAVSKQATGASWDDQRVETFAKATPLYVFKELEAAVNRTVRSLDQGEEFDALVTKLESEQPTINLNDYKSRFKDVDSVHSIMRGPWLETSMLAYLRAEAKASPPDDWVRKVIKESLEVLEPDVRTVLGSLRT